MVVAAAQRRLSAAKQSPSAGEEGLLWMTTAMEDRRSRLRVAAGAVAAGTGGGDGKASVEARGRTNSKRRQSEVAWLYI